MLAEVWRGLRWSLSLGAKIARVVPKLTFLLVCVALVSQVAMLLASFLPLKVVILLGSEGVPGYLPSPLKAVGRDALIGLLSLITVGFFVVHLMAEKIVDLLTGAATSRLLAKSHKLVLFERQEEVAAGAYQRFSRALAGGVFVALALLGMSFVYPLMTLVILAYLTACVVLILGLGGFSQNFRERLSGKLAPTLNFAAGVGFFVAFGFLVIDFIFLSPPGVIFAIVSLLLTRMIMLKCVNAIVDLSSLSRQRSKLDALFFHGRVFVPPSGTGEKSVWSLVEPMRRDEWLNAVMKEFVDSWTNCNSASWIQSGVPNVVALRVHDEEAGSFLVKLFEPGRRALALHEATLTAENISGLPAPELVGNTQIKNYHCLIYRLGDGRQPDREEARYLQEEIRGQLLVVQPPQALLQLFSRSKPSLWQRLADIETNRLLISSGTEKQRELVLRFLEVRNAISEHLRILPLVFVNPDINQSSVYLTEMGHCLLNWGRWSLDPIGSGWRDGPKQMEKLRTFFETAKAGRKDLHQYPVEGAELAALTYSFETKCARQLYSEAIDLLPLMLEKFEASVRSNHLASSALS